MGQLTERGQQAGVRTRGGKHCGQRSFHSASSGHTEPSAGVGAAGRGRSRGRKEWAGCRGREELEARPRPM